MKACGRTVGPTTFLIKPLMVFITHDGSRHSRVGIMQLYGARLATWTTNISGCFLLISIDRVVTAHCAVQTIQTPLGHSVLMERVYGKRESDQMLSLPLKTLLDTGYTGTYQALGLAIIYLTRCTQSTWERTKAILGAH